MRSKGCKSSKSVREWAHEIRLCPHQHRRPASGHAACGAEEGPVQNRMRDEGEQSGGMVCCEACGTAVPAYDVVNYGSIEQGYRQLCNRCFNAEVAGALGLERFENVRLHPVVMTD